MTYEMMGAGALDYQPCRYGTSKLLFRGPKRPVTGRYAAFLGGTETYGKFIARPYPALVEARLEVPCLNLGWSNAGVDVLLHDSEIVSMASRAQVAVVQITAAQNISNRFYSVHPRRNDRFVQASPLLRAIFGEVDFTEFHFTRHMLRHLAEISPGRFATVRDEVQRAWVARMRLLLSRIEAPVVLLWMSAHRPREGADAPDICEDPAFVTRAMLDVLRDRAAHVVEVTASRAALAHGIRGMVHSEFEANAAAELPGPAAHGEVADALLPLVRRYVEA